MSRQTDNGKVEKQMLQQAIAIAELGAPGLKISGGLIDEEFLPELRGRKAARVFEEMRQNDPTIGAVLIAIEHLLKQIPWTVQAASDAPQAKELQEFVSGALFHDMSTSWQEVLSEILTMVPFGWAYLEVVYKLRKGPGKDPTTRSNFNDGRIGWRKWSLRGQNTLVRWEFDEAGGIQAMVQNPPPAYRQTIIPIEKAMLFRTVAHRNNPEGRSLLRNAYRPWFFKKHIEEIEGIGVERDLAGYPVFKIDKEAPDIWNKNDPDALAVKAKLESIITAVKRDEQEGMMLPWWVDFQLVSTGSRRAFDTTAIISRYDQRIAMSLMADFILLGSSDVGSFALSTDKSSMFASILDGLADNIAEIINRHGIPRLLDLNNWPLDLAPRLDHGKVEPKDIAGLAEFAAKLGAGGLIQPSVELEAALLESAGLPVPPEVRGLEKAAWTGQRAFRQAMARYKQAHQRR